MCKRLFVAFLLLGTVFTVALFPQKTPQALAAGVGSDRRQVIILDAGHEALRKPKNKGSIA